MSKTKSASSGTPYLNPNDITASRSARAAGDPDDGGQLAGQLVDVEARGVDDDVRVGPQVAQQLALGLDAVEEPPLALQRVRAAHALEPADQRLVGGVEEHQLRVPAVLADRGDAVAQLGAERPGAHVDHGGDAQVAGALVAGPLGQHRHRRDAAAAAGCRRRTSRGPPGRWPPSSGRRRSSRVTTRKSARVRRLRPSSASVTACSFVRRGPRRSPGRRPACCSAEPNSAATTAASAGPMPGTSASSSTDAARIRLTEPNRLSSALRRFSPSPGRRRGRSGSSPCDRRWRWKVIAKRCASSRTRCRR